MPASDLFPRSKTPAHGVQCVVRAAPDDTDTLLAVDWEADSEDGPETVGEDRVKWFSNGRMPAIGDTAVLLADDRGDVWAFVWATGDPLWTAA